MRLEGPLRCTKFNMNHNLYSLFTFFIFIMTPFRILFIAFFGSEAHGSLLQQSESDDYGFLVDRGPTSDSNLKYNSKLQKEAESLAAFCFGAKKDAFCTDQCRKVARISVQRICQDRKFLSDTYKELVPCDHVGPGVCRWFRCHCHPLSEPNGTKVTEITEVTLGFCKKTLLRYFELNKELGTVGFQKD